MLCDILCVNKLYDCMEYQDTIKLDIRTLVEGYKACIKKYGRCVSKVYIDKDDKTYHIGYVFEQYIDGSVLQYCITFYKSKQTVYDYLTD